MPTTLWESGGKLVQNAGGTALVECASCPCNPCMECSGATPATLYLTVSDLVQNGPGGCADCPDLNSDVAGVYALTQDPASPCVWRYSFDPTGPCNHIQVAASLGTGVVAVMFYTTGMNPSFSWSKAIALPTACTTLDETLGPGDFTGTAQCTGATARVHAVL